MPPSASDRAHELLGQMLGPAASFRDGQLQAIVASVEERARTLIVQRTGWGKSLVYFIASKILREQGAGPTLLISPLLSLMRNQVEAAERIGIRAARLDSETRKEWDAIESRLAANDVDVLLVSPERLANQRFQSETIPLIAGGIGLLVIDEAHCISDWGHDFRPDYRRIVRIAHGLPANVPVIATTATANDRVIDDVRAQLGDSLRVVRGALARESLKLQTIRLADQAGRLAWLAEHLPRLPGSGIVYCLTTADCDRVAAWLRHKGIDAVAYHAQMIQGRFDDELVAACADMIRSAWQPQPAPVWVTAVPSLRRPTLVPDLAARLAQALQLPFVQALRKRRETPPQKTMENSAQQMANIADAFEIVHGSIDQGPVLLVDDMVDSRWTLTECASVLRGAGSGPVFPVALATTAGVGDGS